MQPSRQRRPVSTLQTSSPRSVKPAWQSIRALAKLMGSNWKYAWAEDVFEEMAGRIKELDRMSYDQLDEFRGIELGQGSRPVPHPREYQPHFFRPQFLDEEHQQALVVLKQLADQVTALSAAAHAADARLRTLQFVSAGALVVATAACVLALVR